MGRTASYILDGQTVDSVELKCLVVSRGVKIDREVYQKLGPAFRIALSDGTPVLLCLKYYRRAKEMLAQLYVTYHLEPAGGCGLNVCVERDIYRWASGAARQRGNEAGA